MENNIYYNEADGTGYFSDGNDWYMMPRNTDETYDYECISRVDEMHSDGCSEQDIESVNTFLEENRKIKLMEIRCGSVANEGFTKVKTDSARGYTWVKNEEVA